MSSIDLSAYDLSKCTLESCPLILAHIHYVPSLVANIVYLSIFAVLLIAQIILGIRYRTWGFLGGMVGGLILEILGYAARIQMHYNQFIDEPFFVYVIALTLAPAFLTASIYLTLGRIVTVYGKHLSRFKPRTYTIVFIICDLVSLILQAVGGAFAASSSSTEKLGEHIMLGGLCFQVFSLVLFSILCVEFALRVRSAGSSRNMSYTSVTSSKRFKIFLFCIALATLLITIRSSFRVAELEHGFASSIANDQTLFMALEGPMIMAAVTSLTLLHPGFAFNGEWNAASWSFRSKRSTKGPVGGENC